MIKFLTLILLALTFQRTFSIQDEINELLNIGYESKDHPFGIIIF